MLPFGLTVAESDGAQPAQPQGPLPLSGVRVLDFSWVIAGPTTTRYLAAMGADVIKVEAPGRGDPGRASELHTVLGQAKRGIVLDLKVPEAVDVARSLAERCDVLVENFATGVMDRLGLGAAALQRAQSRPDLRVGIGSGANRAGIACGGVWHAAAMLCGICRAEPASRCAATRRVRMARSDVRADAGVRRCRRTMAAPRYGGVARVDFSMIEAMLWTMAEPLLATQLDGAPVPQGNASKRASAARCVPLCGR